MLISDFCRTFAGDMIKKSILLVIVLAICVLPISANTENKKESLFDWSVNATLTSNYIWRGLYCGGPSLQLDATVGYAGFYANMWWNIGATDWTFSQFNPELDLSIGFSRWGLSIYYIHCFYFDQYPDGTSSKLFDFKNHPKGAGGTTGEWRVAYRVSDRLPLSCLVAVRTFSRDGYMVDGELKRAYSTYIELGYDFILGEDWQLDARLGMTPAKSLYTGFQGDFAITMIGLKLHKTWEFCKQGDENKRLNVKAFAHMMLQPWQVTKDNLIKPITEAGDQKLNLAVGCSVIL